MSPTERLHYRDKTDDCPGLFAIHRQDDLVLYMFPFPHARELCLWKSHLKKRQNLDQASVMSSSSFVLPTTTSVSCTLASGNNRELKETKTATAMKTPSNKRFNEQKKAVHVRYKPLYISLPSPAKQQREMTKFWVF